MKRIILPFLLLFSSIASATTYYVSTSGSDSNNGLSTSAPWATLSWAESHATAPGDIIALKKGDTWSLATSVVIKHGGTTGSPVTWDGSLWGSGANGKILNTKDRGDGNNALVHFITSGSHDVVFKNIIADGGNHQCFGIVIGYHSAISGNAQNNEHDITIDGCSILNIGSGAAYNQGFLCGTWYTDIWNITIQNCTLDGADDEQLTFYGGRTDEWDAQARECRNVVIRNNTLTNWGRRGQSTGYGMQINNKATNVLIEGNTLTQGASGKGDAFHLESNEPIAGYYPTGVIFRYNKLTVNRTNEWCVIVQKGQAMTMTAYSNIFIHTSSSNTSGGNIWIISNGTYTGAKLNFYNNTFYTRTGRSYEDDSHLTGVCTFKNNIIYHAGTLSTDNPVIISSAGSTVHSNNLYYRVGTGDVFLVSEGGSSKYQSTITSWEPTAKKDDPLFTNVSGYDFTLKSGSCAIGSGVVISTVVSDMSSNLYANPPSMGAFESSTTSTSPVIPVYVSSVIQDATPSLLEMNYNANLAAIIPAASAFSVMVNSAARTVNSVSVSGTKVSLTLSTPVISGDVVTVSYTKPVTNPLQTVSGGMAASISAKPVTNNTRQVVLVVPVYKSSVIQNSTPALLELTYDVSLANIVPAVSAFSVLVSSIRRTIISVSITGGKVRLTLSSPVLFGDVVSVSYSQPATNPLQTASGGKAASISFKTVTNNVAAVENANTPPVIVVNYEESSYSGFVSSIDASNTYDGNKDNLIYLWDAPENVALSSNSDPDIQFLSPVVNGNEKIDFFLDVSDGKSIRNQSIPINIQTYKPEIPFAVIAKVQASSYEGINYPGNIIDNKRETKWSTNGSGQWISFKLTNPCRISHLGITFPEEQKRSSYFDIYASEDSLLWDPVLLNTSSCNFSGDYQVFVFPESKSNIEYSYVKLVGKGNPQDSWNNFSELKIFGISRIEEAKMTIYPNPAINNVNISIEYPDSPEIQDLVMASRSIRIYGISGTLVAENPVEAGNNNFQIPLSLESGFYIVHLVSNGITISAQKLIINN